LIFGYQFIYLFFSAFTLVCTDWFYSRYKSGNWSDSHIAHVIYIFDQIEIDTLYSGGLCVVPLANMLFHHFTRFKFTRFLLKFSNHEGTDFGFLLTGEASAKSFISESTLANKQQALS